MTRLQLFFLSFAGLLAPAAFAFAQTKPKITIILEQMIRTTNGIVWLLVTLATVIFFWGLVKYITASESPEEQKKSRGLMLWGFIGLTVVLGFWGIIHILAVYFGVSQGSVQFFFASPQAIIQERRATEEPGLDYKSNLTRPEPQPSGFYPPSQKLVCPQDDPEAWQGSSLPSGCVTESQYRDAIQHSQGR